MTRATNASATKKRTKRLLKKAKGFYGDRKNHKRIAKNAVMKAMADNYTHRKQRKRNFRSLWIVRLSVAAKVNGLSYSKFIHGLSKAKILINRKILSELAIHDPKAFQDIAILAKTALAA